MKNLERVVINRQNQNKKPFYTSSLNIYTRYGDMTRHWIGHSKMNTIDIDEFFKRNVFNDATDTENQVSDKQAEYLNSKSAQIYQDVTLTVEAQNEYTSVNPEEQDVTITFEE